MRQIVLDTETTGLDPREGHRIIEIGAVELLNRQMTENTFHYYINPERDVDTEALQVHNISNEFLQDKPTFAEIYQQFLNYVGEDELIIHNAPFDLGFLNHELKLVNKQWSSLEQYCSIWDTLVQARQQYPGQRNNLDALCKRLDVHNSRGDWHGALLDAEILARVYLAMTGGQVSLFDQWEAESSTTSSTQSNPQHQDFKQWDLPTVEPTQDELVEHQAFLQLLMDTTGRETTNWS